VLGLEENKSEAVAISTELSQHAYEVSIENSSEEYDETERISFQ
jgi:hypothetical protein